MPWGFLAPHVSLQSGDGELQTFFGRVYNQNFSCDSRQNSHLLVSALVICSPSVLICVTVVHRWQAYTLPIPLGTVAFPAAEVRQLHCTVSTQ